jgi:hypothetical protein
MDVDRKVHMPKTAKTSKTVKPVYRHASHAEWGLGMIVEETSSKIYLAFEDGGRRPFLNVQRYRELLVPEELASEAREEIIEKISKKAAKPAERATPKKTKKKAIVEESEEELPAVEDEDRGEGEEDDE